MNILLFTIRNDMSEENKSCYLIQEKDTTVVFLKETIDIRHSDELKTILLQALAFKLQLRIDLSNLNELDLSTLQLLYAAKKSADNEGISFTISPVSQAAKTIIKTSHVLDELSI